MSIIINSFALSGYRSFGPEAQTFETLSKINLIIGKNNSGKSNLLRFFTERYPAKKNERISLNTLDQHMPSGAGFSFGYSVPLKKDGDGNTVGFSEYITPKLTREIHSSRISGDVLMLLSERANQLKKNDAWFFFNESQQSILEDWTDAFNVLIEHGNTNRVARLWRGLTTNEGGDIHKHWIPEIVKVLSPEIPYFKTTLIPAFRQIKGGEKNEKEFCGSGVIDDLAKLQNPNFSNQDDKKKFKEINDFLRSVTNNDSATIDIPHERDTVLVHMDGKTLPLEALGTGIHQVIILAVAATVHENTLFCMEEPELHLNPLLQRKLLRYLNEFTNNQYLITTHSSSLIDTSLAEVYHVQLIEGASIVKRVTSGKDRSSICEDLGYHPSDLVQANCIIWVEGPSDRIYINEWIKQINDNLIEGIHYSIMFYGGRLSSHLTGKDVDEDIETFISLRRLNRRTVIVMDSDRVSQSSRINQTKRRLKEEFDTGPGFAWITNGREIENYVEEGSIHEAIIAVHPKSKVEKISGKYSNLLNALNTKQGRKSADKVKVANYIVKNYKLDVNVPELKKNLNKLVNFIIESNPSI